VNFRLRFPISKVPQWAAAYEYAGEKELLATVPRRVKRARYLTKDDLVQVAEWKSARIRSRIASNADAFVREVTEIALSTPQERLRLHVLLALHGVGWPVASVILHLCHKDRYPILDFRALWSASADVPNYYTFEFWEAYTAFCRKTATAAGVSMRDLDRALWQYSKEKQPRS
jgi:hypothetical protein